MNRTLLPYQARWVADKAGLKAIEKSRRIGLSWAEAYDAVMHAGEDRGNVHYQSYNKDMTRGFIDDCAAWARTLDAGAEAVGETLIRDGARDVLAYRLELASGKEVLAMTSAPRALALLSRCRSAGGESVAGLAPHTRMSSAFSMSKNVLMSIRPMVT